MDNIKIEVCAYSVQSAINAAEAGADRIELCDNFLEGGTTPSYGAVELARKKISIKLNVLIRPRGGDFLYSPVEFETMLKDISTAKKLGADGIAVGVLTSDGHVDEARMKKIMKSAGTMSVTFHRAFDCVADQAAAMEKLIELGVDRILTSGLKKSAYKGKEIIARIVQKAGERIIIMPGSGIDEKNIEELVNVTKAKEYHLSGKSVIKSEMNFLNTEINFSSSSLIPSGDYIESDQSKIKAVIEIINKM
jgi:copper homeostasis protein